MDKYGVETSEEKIKIASEGKGCPKCGGALSEGASPPHCPVCGTEPFEGKENASDKKED